MCNRTTNDPLLRIFLDKYGLHLLSIPREKAQVGDLYVHDGKRVSTPGQVKYFLDPPLTMPHPVTGESMADVVGQLTQGISIKVGLSLLEGFLTALGAGGALTKLRTGFETKGTKIIKFCFEHATRDHVDVMQLGSKLARHKIKQGNAIYGEGNHYYMVTAVARSSSISINAENENNQSVDLDAELLKVGEGDMGVSVSSSGTGKLTFKGKKSLAFGVELYELMYDVKRSALRLLLPPGLIKVQGDSEEPIVKPAFIGGPDGDVLLTVE